MNAPAIEIRASVPAEPVVAFVFLLAVLAASCALLWAYRQAWLRAGLMAALAGVGVLVCLKLDPRIALFFMGGPE